MTYTGNESDHNRTSIELLAERLGTTVPRIADNNVIPLGLVLECGDFFGIDLDEEKGTAEERLQVLIDEVGLQDRSGNSLAFARGDSASVAAELASIVMRYRSARASREKRSTPTHLTANGFDFVEAKKKIEVVNRISSLTMSGPETLGPGSKERKSVLTNLYKGLYFDEAPRKTKSQLGQLIASKLRIPWDRSCHSTGETITLTGLNRLLRAAITEIDSRGRREGELSVAEEVNAYSGVIMQAILKQSRVDLQSAEACWEGVASVSTMVDSRYRNSRQTEWPGWFFEFCTIPTLMSSFGGGPTSRGTVEFDYEGRRIWDLKSHSESVDISKKSKSAPLNDKASMREAVRGGGIGFIILSGIPQFDHEQDFYEWHYSTVRGKKPSERSANSRKLKTAFALTRLDFFFIDSLDVLDRLEGAKIITDFKQGKQADGSPRKVKYQINIDKAREDDILVNSVDVSDYIKTTRDRGELIDSL